MCSVVSVIICFTLLVSMWGVVYFLSFLFFPFLYHAFSLGFLRSLLADNMLTYLDSVTTTSMPVYSMSNNFLAYYHSYSDSDANRSLVSDRFFDLFFCILFNHNNIFT